MKKYLLFLLGFVVFMAFSKTYYVDGTSGDDAADGSEERPLRTIQRAIDLAADGDEIRVAEGVYEAVVGKSVNLTLIGEGYGKTIIDGDGVRQCYLGTTTKNLFIGFTLRNGFSETDGGGACYGSFQACEFRCNRAERYGGAAYGSELKSCLIASNTAGMNGGAIYRASGYVDNCSIVGNRVTESRDPYAAGASYGSYIRNSAVSCNYNGLDEIQNGYDNTWDGETIYYDNEDGTDLRMVDPLRGDARLRPGSRLIDLARSEYVTYDKDLAGNARISGAKVDAGCYEGVGYDGLVVRTRVRGAGRIEPITGLVSCGGSIEFTAVPTSDREFVRFETNGVEVTTSSTLRLEGVTEDLTLTAVFESRVLTVDSSGEDGSFGEIQSAIDAASDSDEIRVAPGVYHPISVLGKRLTIRSTAGFSETIIDGGGTNRCALLGGDKSSVALQGFTLRNGVDTAGGGARNGRLISCVIEDCRADYRNSNNTSIYSCVGGGAYRSRLESCILIRNRAPGQGAGAASSELYNCTICGNGVDSATSDGAALSGCTTYNSVITRNTAKAGPSNSYVNGSGNVVFSTTSPDSAHLVYAEGCDVRLREKSRLIDSGNMSVYIPEVDITGAPRVQGGRVDVGAYEGGEVSGFAVRGEVELSGRVEPAFSFVEIGASVTLNAIEVDRPFLHFKTNGVVAVTTPTIVLSDIDCDMIVTACFGRITVSVGPDGDFAEIQEAIDHAYDGETIRVAPGVYGPIDTGTKNLTLIAEDGRRDVTVIDGGGKNRCATLGLTTAAGSSLCGFTLRNGFATNGGGACYGKLTACYIHDCVAKDNTNHCGGGAYYCNLYDCEIYNNRCENAGPAGGGIYGGTATYCVISNNVSTGSVYVWGGGAYNATLNNCLVAGNLAECTGKNADYFARGGGMAECTAKACTIVDNRIVGQGSSLQGAGASGVKMRDCIVWGNYSETTPQIAPMTEDIVNTLVDAPPFFADYENGDYRLVDTAPYAETLGWTRETVPGVRIAVAIKGWGSVESQIVKVDAGGRATLRAMENGPRPFLRWEDDEGRTVSCDPVLNLENVTESRVMTAVFAAWTVFVDAEKGDDSNDGFDVTRPLRSITRATEVCYSGETIRVAEGVYEPIRPIRNNVTIIGTGDERTIIDGGGTNRCFCAYMKEGVELIGFVLRNGGNVYNGGGAQGGILKRCVIRNCKATIGAGCANSRIESCLLVGNTASDFCGGSYYATAYNCTYVDNHATGTRSNTAVGSYDGTNYNSLFYNNTTRDGTRIDTYTASNYAWPSRYAVILDDPSAFVDYEHGDYRLADRSPAIDVGETKNVYVPELDLDGRARVNNRLDAGAYEYYFVPTVEEVTDENGETIGSQVTSEVTVSTDGTTTSSVTITTETNCFEDSDSAKPVTVVGGIGSITFDTQAVREFGQALANREELAVDASIRVKIEDITASMNPEAPESALTSNAELIFNVSATIGDDGRVNVTPSAATTMTLTDIDDRSPVLYRTEGRRRIRVPADYDPEKRTLTFTIPTFNTTYSVEYTDLIIDSREDWSAFAASVAAGESYVNKLVALTTTLDFEGASLEPVGTEDHPFDGLFQGNGQTISNFSVTSETAAAGVFAYTRDAVIHGLTVAGGQVNGESAGALIGSASGYLWIKGCVVRGGSVVGTSAAGGFVGKLTPSGNKLVEIEDGFNSATVTARVAGGIVGDLSASGANLSRLLNDGSVVGEKAAGGIVSGLTSISRLSVSRVVSLGSVRANAGRASGISSVTATVTKAFTAAALAGSSTANFVSSGSMSSVYRGNGANYYTSGNALTTADVVATVIGTSNAVASHALIAFTFAGERRLYPGNVTFSFDDFVAAVIANCGRFDGSDYQGYANYRSGKLTLSITSETKTPYVIKNGTVIIGLFEELSSLEIRNVTFAFRQENNPSSWWENAVESDGSEPESVDLTFENYGDVTIGDCVFDRTAIVITGGGSRDESRPTQTILSGNEFVNIPGWAIRCFEQSSLYVQVNVFRNIGGAIFAEEISDLISATGNHFETTIGKGHGETMMQVNSTVSAALVVWGDNKLAEGENAALRVPISEKLSAHDWAEITQGSKFLGFYPVKSSGGSRYVEVESQGSGRLDYVLDTNVSVDGEKRFTGGNFRRDPSAFVASGYKTLTEESGYKVVAYLAKIVNGNGSFVSASDSLQEALDTAEDGQRIVQQISGDIPLELPDYEIGRDVAVVLAPGVVNTSLAASASSVVEKRRGADGSVVCQAIAVTDSVTLRSLTDADGRSMDLTFTTDWMLANGVSPRQLADTTYVAANGLSIWESYVMGLDSGDHDSVLSMTASFEDDHMRFELTGGALKSDIVEVSYVLYATSSLDRPFEKISEAQDSSVFELEKSSDPSRFYKIGVELHWR